MSIISSIVWARSPGRGVTMARDYRINGRDWEDRRIYKTALPVLAPEQMWDYYSQQLAGAKDF